MQTLRRFVKRRQPGEHCELCSLALSAEHAHLIELDGHRLLCCCEPCAVLFDNEQGGAYRRVSRDVERLNDLRLDDDQWGRLDVPVDLVFFCHFTARGRVVAQYPSPAGAMESLLELEEWQVIVAANPVLNGFAPDVEALLVNRVRQAREYYRVPMDECYRLVGSVRASWSGFSGGSEVEAAIAQFFERLAARAIRQEVN
jgi:hypothetical protein